MLFFKYFRLTFCLWKRKNYLKNKKAEKIINKKFFTKYSLVEIKFQI